MIEIEYSRIFCYFDTMYNGKANKMSCLPTVSMEIPSKVNATQRKVSVIRVCCIQVEFVYLI